MSDLKIKITNAKNIDQLATALENTYVKVSFLGTREVKKEMDLKKKASDPGPIKLKLITQKAMKLLRPFLKDWNYSIQDRRNIKKITQRIDSFYEKSDEILEKSNVITILFNNIQKFFALFFCVFYTTRGKWTQLSNLGLSYCYSEKQYELSFPRNELPKEVDEKYKNINLYFKPDLINRNLAQKIAGYSN
ncbi:MAG: hypothetical protein K940chlam1_00457 [Candidatus Anoxychlamydiales bacterium]|nr:hypothetical protein [Candidatus Anoxychlamydiales bacterium]NGX35272.1 hypothetical protein [Candidatus Anoxychlamydiales bacterium]